MTSSASFITPVVFPGAIDAPFMETSLREPDELPAAMPPPDIPHDQAITEAEKRRAEYLIKILASGEVFDPIACDDSDIDETEFADEGNPAGGGNSADNHPADDNNLAGNQNPTGTVPTCSGPGSHEGPLAGASLGTNSE
ncbi:hypothetical protein H0H81_011103, partial [Sphagnurus paluster]